MSNVQVSVMGSIICVFFVFFTTTMRSSDLFLIYRLIMGEEEGSEKIPIYLFIYLFIYNKGRGKNETVRAVRFSETAKRCVTVVFSVLSAQVSHRHSDGLSP